MACWGLPSAAATWPVPPAWQCWKSSEQERLMDNAAAVGQYLMEELSDIRAGSRSPGYGAYDRRQLRFSGKRPAATSCSSKKRCSRVPPPAPGPPAAAAAKPEQAGSQPVPGKTAYRSEADTSKRKPYEVITSVHDVPDPEALVKEAWPSSRRLAAACGKAGTTPPSPTGFQPQPPHPPEHAKGSNRTGYIGDGL